MCNNTLDIGDAFLLDTPPKGMHLFIARLLLADTRYLFVNATKKQNNSDLSCIIKPGAGVPTFIYQESVIHYRKPREIDLSTILTLSKNGKCIYKGKFSPNILYRIQLGATRSEKIPIKYEKLMKEYLGIET